jgi:hypothetical protein
MGFYENLRGKRQLNKQRRGKQRGKFYGFWKKIPNSWKILNLFEHREVFTAFSDKNLGKN